MPPSSHPPLRIVFIGAECTGKTTIATEVARSFNEPCSAEFVRQYAQALDRPLEARDLDPIARGQIRIEDEARDAARQYVFHDTNLLSSILYAEHYFDSHLAWVDEAFSQRTYSLYFLCSLDVPWEDDPGQRVGPNERAKLQPLFQKILSRYNIDPVTLSGPIEKRIQTVLTTLTGLQPPR